MSKLVSITIPSFSLPLTRTETNALASKLAKDFQSQGLTVNDAKTKALQVITFKQQGLTDSQIQKNFSDTEKFQADKEAQRQKEILAQQQKQQPLLDQLAKEKAEREKLAKASQDRESRTLEEIRNFGKDNEILVANPRDPRGKLIPKSEALKIQAELNRVGGIKEADPTSIGQKNNPSILDSLRKLLSNEKSGVVEVVAINRSFVQLSDGTLKDRATFTGTIPQKLLDAEKVTVKAKTPDNAPLGGVTTFSGVTKIVDPTKTVEKITDPTKTTGKRPSKSVFQQDKPETTPVADTLKTVTDSISGAIDSVFKTPEATAQTKTETKPFDPLGDLVNFFTPKTETKTETKPVETPTTPKTTDPSKQETTTTTGNKPAPEPEKQTNTLDKVTKFVTENGVKIAIGGISSIFILGLALTVLPKDNRNLERLK